MAPFFIILGLVSMAWLIPWLAWIPRGETAISPVEKGGPGFLELLKNRSVWGRAGASLAQTTCSTLRSLAAYYCSASGTFP